MKNKKYCWLILLAALTLTMLCGGVGHALANEVIPVRSSSREERKVPPSNATPSDATPSDASPSDASPATPSDAEPDEIPLVYDLYDGGCRTQRELVEQLLDDSRDRIVLNADIEWSENISVFVSGEKEVDMGPFSIRIGAGSCFDVSGTVVFTGGGGEGPLFESHGFFNAGDGVEIRADGDNVVAVHVIGGTCGAEHVQIRASGKDACAIRFSGLSKYEVKFCEIEAEGEGSRGIEAEGDLTVMLSSVSGEESAVSSEQGELRLFGCSLTPEPEDAEMVPALVVPNNRMEENGICIAAGSSLEQLKAELTDYRNMSWRFFSEDAEVNCFYTTLAVWSELPQDISRPGTWMMQYAPKGVPEWFPAELYSLEVPIHVIAPDQPFIMDAEDAGKSAFLRFFSPVQDAENLCVEYSVDERKSWRDSAELPASFVNNTNASIEPLTPNQDYWFRLVVKGGPMEGISNEILFIGDAVRKANGGGSRDNGDRDDQGEDPPHGEIIPPPDETETSGGSLGGTTQDSASSGETGRPEEPGEQQSGKPEEPGEQIAGKPEASGEHLSGIPDKSGTPDEPGEQLSDRPDEPGMQKSGSPEEPGAPASGKAGKTDTQISSGKKESEPDDITDTATVLLAEDFYGNPKSRVFCALLISGAIVFGGAVYVGRKKRKGKHENTD